MQGDDSLPDDGNIDEIKELIGNASDNGVISLEGKTYDVNKNTSILIRKNLTIEGVEGKTVIDGNNFTLTLNTFIPVKNPDLKIGFWKNGYEIANTGKSLTLKNITFTNLKLKTWHEMNFIDCRFINSTFTSHEMNSSFEGCSFTDSKIEILNYLGVFPKNCTPYHAKIDNCEFLNSRVTSKIAELTTYVALVGSSIFQTINSMDISNSNFDNSNLELTYYKANISDCNFTGGSWVGSSSIFNISNVAMNNPNVKYYYSVFSMTSSIMSNGDVGFSGGYFSRGCEIYLNKCDVNGTEIKIDEGMHSRKSKLNITDSNLNASYIDSTFSWIILMNSTLNETGMRLLYNDVEFKNSTFINREKPSNAISSYNSTFKLENSYFIYNNEKYELTINDITFDNLQELSYDQKEFYYVGDELTIHLKDHRGKAIAGTQLIVTDVETSERDYYYTDENGTITHLLQRGGNLNLIISTSYGSSDFGRHEFIMSLNLTVNSIPIDINVSSLSTTYGVRSRLSIGLISNDTNKTLNGFTVSVKIFTGKKFETYEVETKGNGTATFKIPKKLASGKHNVLISTRDLISKEITINVKKAKTIVKAPKVTNKLGKSQYFKVGIYSKANGQAVKNRYVKIKIDKKTYNVKTNKKGIAKINTKSLKTGKHRVVISSGNSNYKISAKTAIKIKK